MDKNSIRFDEDRSTIERYGITLELTAFEYDVLMTLWCVLPGSIDIGELLDECRHWGSLHDGLDGMVQLNNAIYLINSYLGDINLRVDVDDDEQEIMLRLL